MLKTRVITAIVLLAGLLSALFLLPAGGWLLLCAAVAAGAGWSMTCTHCVPKARSMPWPN